MLHAQSVGSELLSLGQALRVMRIARPNKLPEQCRVAVNNTLQVYFDLPIPGLKQMSCSLFVRSHAI